MAIDVSFRDGYSTSAQDLSRFNKNFIINQGVANDGLKVSQSVVPAMSVLVTAGTSYFYGTGTTADTMFEFYSDSTETVTIPTAAAQARIDIVCCKVDVSTGVASLVVVSGTPSGSPAVPATPASHYKLAEVAVGASVTTITNANITDTRKSVFVAPTGARNQGLINGKIVPTVASNNLTVAIKTLTDTDPTATNPVGIWIGNELRWITSALSVITNAGSSVYNAGSVELATREIDYFVYLGYGTVSNRVFIGVSRVPYARIQNDLNVVSTGNEKFLNRNESANGTDDIVNVGRFAATNSGTASFNWSVPAFTNANLIQEPIYETRWLNWTPAYTQTGGMTFTSVTTTEASYKVFDRYVKVNFRFDGTTGGAADSQIEFTVPFTPSTVTINITTGIFDGGSAIGITRIESGRQLGAQKFTGVIANWGLGASKFVNGTGDYLI